MTPVASPVAIWERWTPDAVGLARLRRLRRPRRLWCGDLAAPPVDDDTLSTGLAALTAADRHAFVVATQHPDRLGRAASRHFLRHGGAEIPEHVLLAVVVARPEAFLDLTWALPCAPARALGLVLRSGGAPVPAALLASALTPPGGGGFDRVLVERELAQVLPGWARALGDACAAAGAALEQIPGALIAERSV